MARATSQEQTGSIGASEAIAMFERIGWGFAEVARHDNGIDVFLMARDERLFDLGLTLGAQIKAGPSYFSRPERRQSDVVGWWFQDRDGEHLRDLVEHGLPQLLVLYDLDARIAYWVHVTAEAVVSTGLGAKILVPRKNRVDEPHRAVLLEIAGSARAELPWQGSAWTGLPTLPERAALRTAMFAPRLVAPHANLGHGRPISADQAIAILMQCRLNDYAAFAEKHDSVPKLDEARTSRDWSWRLVGALGHRLTSGELDELRGCIDDAPSPFQRAAAVSLWVGHLLAAADPDSASQILHAELALGYAMPIDHEWLKLHQARAFAETGRVAEARQVAGDIQGIGFIHRTDVGAAAIDGAAAQLLFRLSDIWTGDVSLAVRGRDTAVAWWRQQTRSWGLGTALDRTFEQWGRDRRHHLMRGDGANDHLLSAAITATVAGDHDDWRYLTEALGRWGLMQVARDDELGIRSGLTSLRLAGDDEGLDLAMRMFVDEGPAAAVRDFAEAIDLDTSTRTTARADLAILKAAAPVLSVAFADSRVDTLLSILRGDSAFTDRTSYSPPTYELLAVLVRLLEAASLDGQRRATEHLLGYADIADQLIGDRWAQVLLVIDMEVWTTDLRAEAAQRSRENIASESLRFGLRRIAAETDPSERADLMENVRAGSAPALAAFGNVTELPKDAVAAVLDHCCACLAQERADAAHGAWSFGGPDHADTVALLNVWHTEEAMWEPLLEFLRDAHVRLAAKAAALNRLAHLVDRLSDEVRSKLRVIVQTLAESSPHPIPDIDMTAAASSAALVHIGLALELPDEDTSASMLRLAAGGPDERAWCARLAGVRMSPDDAVTLLLLSVDHNAQVRGAAAVGLLRLLAQGRATPQANTALARLLGETGLMVPLQMAKTLAREGSGSSAVEHIRRKLLQSRFNPICRAASEDEQQ